MKRLYLLLPLFYISISVFSSNQDVDYLDVIDRSLYIEKANLKMEIYKNDKLIKYYKMEFYRHEEKMRMEFTEPAVEKGRRMLNDNSNLWMYLPRTSKVVKLPFKQSFMGSDASNRDLMKVSLKKDYEVTNIVHHSDSIVKIELKAKDLSVSYNKVVLTFDAKRQVLLQQEMYSLSGKIITTMMYENIVKIDDIFMPTIIVIKNELSKDSITKLYYSNIQRKSEKNIEYFSLDALKKQ
ncbi:MAG: outer membrane lipoprotein-sorting protein [Dysgonamonadaceae bacterium]|jgi:outer membrane lipoprotein-sorting protein|nr:outer membrane lipoprotein-sorting protein [Dysgonamonadaceae bacterium]